VRILAPGRQAVKVPWAHVARRPRSRIRFFDVLINVAALSAVVLALGVLQGPAPAQEEQPPRQLCEQPPQQQQQSGAATPIPPSAPASGLVDQHSLERIRTQLEQPQPPTIVPLKPDMPLYHVEVFGYRFRFPEWQKDFVIPVSPVPQPFGGSDYYEMMRLITPPLLGKGADPQANRDGLGMLQVAGETWLAGLLVKRAVAAHQKAAPARARREVLQELAAVAAHNARVAAGQADGGADAKASTEKKKPDEKKKKQDDGNRVGR